MAMRITFHLLLVLSRLLEAGSEDTYGFDILRDTGLKSGTVYPILARLEEAGWVSSFLEDIDPKVEGRRQRRYYRLTALGAPEARRLLKDADSKHVKGGFALPILPVNQIIVAGAKHA